MRGLVVNGQFSLVTQINGWLSHVKPRADGPRESEVRGARQRGHIHVGRVLDTDGGLRVGHAVRSLEVRPGGAVGGPSHDFRGLEPDFHTNKVKTGPFLTFHAP